jgi:hypothetical protein
MSLDNIQLSKKTIQQLFTHNLVQTTVEPPQKAEISSLGENQKNILFVVNSAQNKFLPDDEMDLLSNLISACKLSMADIALVNYFNHSIDFSNLERHFKPEKILIFGITTSELKLPFTIPFFQIQSYNEQFYLTVPALKDFLHNIQLKKELWNCLKKLFLPNL